MTDFRQEYPITVAASASIDAALAYMNRLHLHALLVIREEAAAFEISVLGLITAYEILRERPFRSPDTKVVRWPRPRTVREAMTPWAELPLIKYESLQSHTAAEGYELFKGTGLT